MKSARIALALITSGLLWVAGGTPSVSACSCEQVTTEVAFGRATDVFVGRVETVDDIDEFQEPYEVAYVVQIAGVFKGEAFATQLLTTPQRGGGCGSEMTVNGSYLVHANRRNGTELSTSLCAGNQPIGLEAASALLGGAAEPFAGVDPAVTDLAAVEVSKAEVSVSDWMLGAGLVIGSVVLAIAGIVRGRRARQQALDDDMIG